MQQDQYGCVAFNPLLPPGETENSQKIKRMRLVKLFDTLEDHSLPEISDPMTLTYATQRKVIIAENRDLQILLTEWPFLKLPKFIIEHASIFLVKDVHKTWKESLQNKAKPIRQFFKVQNHAEIAYNLMSTILKIAKEAAAITKSQISKTIVIFPLILRYFAEEPDNLFKVIDVTKSVYLVQKCQKSNVF